MGAGLAEFLDRGPWNVFERLYRDALDRMRRLAEMQAKIYEKTNAEYLRNIGEFVSYHIPLPGEDLQDIRNPAIHSVSEEGKVRQLIEGKKPKLPVQQVPDHVASGTGGYPSNSMNLLEPLSVMQLLDDSPRNAAVHVRKGQEEPKLHKSSPRHDARIRSPRQDPVGDLSLCIGSVMPHDSSAGGTVVPPYVTGAALGPPRSNIRGHAAKVPGGLAEGESLPKLECRGQGRAGHGGEYDSPPRQHHRSQSQAPFGAVASAARYSAAQLLSNAEPLLTIGNFKAAVPPSGVPPGVAAEPPPPGKLPGKLHRPGLLASRSAPSLPSGPTQMPRLLMQSVGSIYN